MTAHEFAIVPAAATFSHADACRVYDLAMRCRSAPTVVVDMKHAADASTSAFARLVLLRRELLTAGRDLRLTNLRARAADVYKVNRLTAVLPVRDAERMPVVAAGPTAVLERLGATAPAVRRAADVRPCLLAKLKRCARPELSVAAAAV